MSELTLSITNFLFKLVTVLLVLFVASLIDPFLFTGYWVMFTTALITAVVGVVSDMTLLTIIGNVKALGVDFIVNTVLIAFAPSILFGSTISMLTALACSLVIGWLEFYVHRIILRSEKLTRDAHE